MRYAPPWWPAAIGACSCCFSTSRSTAASTARTGAALAVAPRFSSLTQWLLVGRLFLLAAAYPARRGLDFLCRSRPGRISARAQERHAAMVQFSRFTNPHVAKQLVEPGGIEPGGAR